MHIPDNYLSPVTCAVMGAIKIPVWRRAVKAEVVGYILSAIAGVAIMIIIFKIISNKSDKKTDIL